MRVEHFSESLEKSLDRVVANLPAKAAETAPEPESEKERVREALRRMTEQSEPAESAESQPVSGTPLPDYMAEENVEPNIQKKLEYLIGVATEKSLSEALRLAKKQDVFIQDALHDALTDKLLPELKSKGHI